MKKQKVHFLTKNSIKEDGYRCDYTACGFFAFRPGQRFSVFPDESTIDKRKVTCGNCKRTKKYKNRK